MMPNNGDGGSSEKLCGGGDGGVVKKKGPWTAVEDAILMEYVRQHGEGNWNAVQKNTGLARCGKSCRLRWANHLRPNLKKGSFTPEEERLIVELHSKLGNKWARMASQLPGRTDNEIKNYWNTRIKRRQRQGLSLYPSATTSSNPTTPTTPTTASTFTFFSPSSRPPLFDPSLLSTSPRIPPLLATPLRYTRRRDFSAAAASFSFPVSLSPPSHLPHSLSTSALSHLGSTNAAFQLSYDPNLTHSNSYSNLRTQFEFDNLLLPSSGYNQELPSSQMFSSQTGSEITFDPKVSVNAEKSNSGLLEDLLEEAQTLGCRTRKSLFDDFEEESRGFDVFGQWDASSSVPSSSGANPNGEPAEHVNSMSVHEDLSKLLNFIPSSMDVHDWYGVSEDISVGQSSVVTDESKGLEMQQIASFLPVASTTDHDRTPASCPWDNLPGIC